LNPKGAAKGVNGKRRVRAT